MKIDLGKFDADLQTWNGYEPSITLARMIISILYCSLEEAGSEVESAGLTFALRTLERLEQVIEAQRETKSAASVEEQP